VREARIFQAGQQNLHNNYPKARLQLPERARPTPLNRCQVDIVPIGFEVRFAKRTKEPSLSLTVEVMCEGKLTWSEHRLGDYRITGSRHQRDVCEDRPWNALDIFVVQPPKQNDDT